MHSELDAGNVSSHTCDERSFKKPILVGKIGKLPKKVHQIDLQQKSDENAVENDEKLTESIENTTINEINANFSYIEPAWSEKPQKSEFSYHLEVLKDGKIIDKINIMEKAYWVFGRLPECDIRMAHPTISRFHAVLQHKCEKNDPKSNGFYLYDLNSTHGTYMNKLKLIPRRYVHLQVGHMIKLGCSRRIFILQGPQNEGETFNELTITEAKQNRAEELQKRKIEAKTIEKRDEFERQRVEERGVDWGMGEDADEATDLTVNPFAQTQNEDLYIDDPKKALRGFMEREGLEYEYDIQEQGVGYVTCKVMLPMDDDLGRPLYAEVVHKGKKKEAVVQCALEACRILDRNGLLRQATHESRKRKAKDWEANDYYDSDEDTFLDRTGTIERKRLARIQRQQPAQPETYDTLKEKHTKLAKEIAKIELSLTHTKQTNIDNKTKKDELDDTDTLDTYMKQLTHNAAMDKQKTTKLRCDLNVLRGEMRQVVRLMEIARPTTLPPLNNTPNVEEKQKTSEKRKFPFFAKKLAISAQKTVNTSPTTHTDAIEEHAIVADTSNLTAKTAENDAKLRKTQEINKKRTQKRLQHKQQLQLKEKEDGYVEDASKEDYNMWTPPENQTGDGKTLLNQKFGY